MSSHQGWYKLEVVVYGPSESTEPDKYMAEVPALPGCRAWADTPPEALDRGIVDLAPAFIESTHHSRRMGRPLSQIDFISIPTEPISTEVMVAV